MDRCFKVIDTKTVEPLFAGWESTLIWSCLQGVMGNIYIYVDSIDHPGSAAAPYLSWDAHNKESKALAEKLGYRFDREYTSYEIAGY